MCCFGILAAVAAMSPDERVECEFLDLSQCDEGNSAGCNATEQCEIPDPGKRVHCYALWRNDSGIFELVKKVMRRLLMSMSDRSFVIPMKNER